jgi:hypothetical protein
MGHPDEATTAPVHRVCAHGLRRKMGLRAEFEEDEILFYFFQKQLF